MPSPFHSSQKVKDRCWILFPMASDSCRWGPSFRVGRFLGTPSFCVLALKDGTKLLLFAASCKYSFEKLAFLRQLFRNLLIIWRLAVEAIISSSSPVNSSREGGPNQLPRATLPPRARVNSCCWCNSFFILLLLFFFFLVNCLCVGFFVAALEGAFGSVCAGLAVEGAVHPGGEGLCVR